MARIPESEIERLKREVSVERLAEARGVKLKRHGADLIGLCPFHEDHSPSLVISPKKNLWNCLGACRRGGSVIDWVMRAEGVSFRHAVELLREDHLPLAADPRRSRRNARRCRNCPRRSSRDCGRRALLLQVVSYYHETLEADARGAEVSGRARPEIGGDDRSLPAGLRQPHARLSAAGEEPRGRRGAARTLAEARHLPRERARALQRLGGDPDLRISKAK